MSSFHSVGGGQIFSPLLLLAAWEAEAFGPRPLDTLPKETSTAILQSKSALVRKLWQNFNAERDSLDKYYMSDDKFFEAYLLAFFLPNIQRVFSLFMKSAHSSIIDDLLNKDHINILDFGSGPLSGSIGIICALEHRIATRPDKKHRLKSISIVAIERALNAVECGRTLLEASISSELKIDVSALPSLDKYTVKSDISLCINAINEIPVKHRLKTAVQLFEATAPEKAILIMEPGQDIHARELGSLRDDLLNWAQNKSENISIISPCPHALECPLSSKMKRADWCWFQDNWDRPRSVLTLDRYTRLNHDELNHSFVLFQKSKQNKEAPYARIVSSVFELNSDAAQRSKTLMYAKSNQSAGKVSDLEELFAGPAAISKAILCTRDGSLQSAFGKTENMSANRGDVIGNESEAPLRVNERVEKITTELQATNKPVQSKKPVTLGQKTSATIVHNSKGTEKHSKGLQPKQTTQKTRR